MYVVCSTLCFGSSTLGDALRSIRDYRFAKADLAIHDDSPHLTPAEVSADLSRTCQRLRLAGVPFAAFHFAPADPCGPTGMTHLRPVCRLARALAVPVVTVAAAPLDSDFDREIARLTEWVKVAEGEGVMLCIETHAETLTSEPARVAELCQKVPGLGVTLDPSHYVAAHPATALDAIYPFVRHVRFRDSSKKTGHVQVRVGQGDIEYGRIITQLARCRYDRALSVDVRDVPNSPFPVGPEVRKLKYLLESLV